MLNIGGGELLVIFLVALVVLGPAKLPEAARQAGKVYREFRKISTGFQREFREAMRDPVGTAVRDVTKEAELPPIEAPPAETGSAAAPSETDGAASAGSESDEPPPMPSDR